MSSASFVWVAIVPLALGFALGCSDSQPSLIIDGGPTSGSGTYGDPCTAETFNTDCSSINVGGICFDNVALQWLPAEWPGGYCTAACASPVQDCAPGVECILAGPAFQYRCIMSCEGHDECRVEDGYACLTFGEAGISDHPNQVDTFCLPEEITGADGDT